MKKSFILLALLGCLMATAQTETVKNTPMQYASGEVITETPSQFVGKYYVDYFYSGGSYFWASVNKPTERYVVVTEKGFKVHFTNLHGEKLVNNKRYGYKEETWVGGGCLATQTIGYNSNEKLLVLYQDEFNRCEKDINFVYRLKAKHKK
jgi:hypothetical protein